MNGRRACDAVTIVTNAAPRREFQWTARYDDLAAIVTHAVEWEDRLHQPLMSQAL